MFSKLERWTLNAPHCVWSGAQTPASAQFGKWAAPRSTSTLGVLSNKTFHNDTYSLFLQLIFILNRANYVYLVRVLCFICFMHGGYVTASTDEMDSMVCGISLTKNIEISSSTEYLFGCKVMSFVREKRICFTTRLFWICLSLCKGYNDYNLIIVTFYLRTISHTWSLSSNQLPYLGSFR